MKKTIIALFLALALLVTMTSCGLKDPNNAPATENTNLQRQTADEDESHETAFDAAPTPETTNPLQNGESEKTIVIQNPENDKVPTKLPPDQSEDTSAKDDGPQKPKFPDSVAATGDKPTEKYTDYEFLCRMIDEVKATSTEAGFDPDKAVAFLEKRQNTGSFISAVNAQDTKQLNYLFASVVKKPVITEENTLTTKDGVLVEDQDRGYSMIVAPIAQISKAELGEKLCIHGYAKTLPDKINEGDIILVDFDNTASSHLRIIDGEVIYSTYAFDMAAG